MTKKQKHRLLNWYEEHTPEHIYSVIHHTPLQFWNKNRYICKNYYVAIFCWTIIVFWWKLWLIRWIVYLTQKSCFWHLLILQFVNWFHYIQTLQWSWWSWLSVFLNKSFCTETDWSVCACMFTLDFGRVNSGRFLAFILDLLSSGFFCHREWQLKRPVVFLELPSLCVKIRGLGFVLLLFLVWCQSAPVDWSVSTVSFEMFFWSPLHMKHRVKQKKEPQTGFSELMWANIVMLLHGWLDFSFLLCCCWKKLYVFGTFPVSPFYLSH